MIASITWWHVDVSSQSSLMLRATMAFVLSLQVLWIYHLRCLFRPRHSWTLPRSPQSCENLQSSPHIVTSPVPMWNPPKTDHSLTQQDETLGQGFKDSSFLKFQQNLQQAELAHIHPNSHYGYSTLMEPVLPVLIFPNFQRFTEKWRGLLQASKSSTWGPKIQKIWPKSVDLRGQFRYDHLFL